MYMRLNNWDKGKVPEPFPSFAPNTHKLYILKHCFNIVFILQKNQINPDIYILNYIVNNKITQLSLDCHF